MGLLKFQVLVYECNINVAFWTNFGDSIVACPIQIVLNIKQLYNFVFLFNPGIYLADIYIH